MSLQTPAPHSAGDSYTFFLLPDLGTVRPGLLEDLSCQDPALPGIPLLTPSSSSMISTPMEARVVHLQLFVALTAQRLCALNLQTAWGGAVRSREGPHSTHIPGPKPLHIWAVGITSQHTCSGPALRGCPALIPTPAHLPAGPQH